MSAAVAVSVLVLATTGCSAIGGAHKAGKQTQSMNNLKQIGTACQVYAVQNGGKSPESLQQLVDAELISAKQTKCPITGKPYVFAAYAGNVHGDQLVACEAEASGAERICLLGDGSVQRLSAADFARRLSDPRNAAFASAFAAAGGK